MATTNYAPKVKAEEAGGGWMMHLRQQAQGQTQRYRDNNASQADNGWGNTQARVDPYNQQQVNQQAANQMKSVLGTISPVLEQQRQAQNTSLNMASDRAVINAQNFRNLDQQNTLQQITAGGAAELKAKAEYNNSVAGYNDRQNQQYLAAKQANAQVASAGLAAGAQIASAEAQSEAQKYVAEQAAQANMAGALYGAVGNIASGFGGGGRYW
jgi:hypothetical protein